MPLNCQSSAFTWLDAFISATLCRGLWPLMMNNGLNTTRKYFSCKVQHLQTFICTSYQFLFWIIFWAQVAALRWIIQIVQNSKYPCQPSGSWKWNIHFQFAHFTLLGWKLKVYILGHIRESRWWREIFL